VTPETVFSICGIVAFAGWILLIFAPGWSARFVSSLIIPALLGIVYLMIIVLRFPAAEGGFGSLADVRRLFQDPWLLLAGWVHYLAFDLFIGAWEVRDSRVLRLPHLLVVPCLLLTFLLGPIGLLVYLAVRGALRRAVTVGS